MHINTSQPWLQVRPEGRVVPGTGTALLLGSWFAVVTRIYVAPGKSACIRAYLWRGVMNKKGLPRLQLFWPPTDTDEWLLAVTMPEYPANPKFEPALNSIISVKLPAMPKFDQPEAWVDVTRI